MNDDIKMTQEELATIMSLRYRGYSIIIWTPNELQGVDPDIIQNASVSFGWDEIQNQLQKDEEQ